MTTPLLLSREVRFGRERAQHVVVTAVGLVRAGQDRVDHDESGVRVDALVGEAFTGLDGAVGCRRGVLERAHHGGAHGDHASSARPGASDGVGGPLRDAIRLIEGEPAIERWIAEGAKDDTPASARAQYDMAHPPVYVTAPAVTSVEYSPDGTQIDVAGYHEVLVHKADGSGIVARLVGLAERIQKLAWSPNGKKIAVTGGSPARMGKSVFGRNSDSL